MVLFAFKHVEPGFLGLHLEDRGRLGRSVLHPSRLGIQGELL